MQNEYSVDSSIFKITPKEVIFPKNDQEISHIIQQASISKRNISVRSGGTCMSGGSLNEDCILSLNNNPDFKSIKINQYLKVAEVSAGVYYRDLESEALKYNLMFAPYPSSRAFCGISGMLGNNASGEKSVRFGATIDNVLAVKVFLNDGNIYEFEEITDDECLQLSKEKSFIGNIYKEVRDMYRIYSSEYIKSIGDVTKVASGYRLDKVFDRNKNTWNLAKIFIGSQGTLGIIHSARIKLVEMSTHTRLIVIPIKSLILLPKILEKILQYNPESVETFDINTFIFSKKIMPKDAIKIEKYFADNQELIILAQFDDDNIAHNVFLELKEMENNTDYIYDDDIKTSLWNIRRSSFAVTRDNVYDKETKKAVPCIEDVIVPIEKFDIFVFEMINILKNNKIDYAFHGHIGDGSLRFIPIIDFEDKKNAMDLIIKLMNQVFDLVKELNGNMGADHGDGIIRTPFLKDFYGVDLYENVIVGIKKLFDPEGIFNIRKKIGINKSDLYNIDLK